MTEDVTTDDLNLTEPPPPSVHECIGRIVAELPAIGKNQRNTEQGFNFRGIDDVLNALSPLLGKYGVFYVPDVLERVTEKRQTRSGGTMYEVNLHVRYTFYGPRGDSVSASGWGEGTDMGDKATNKAMTGAMKYVLFQVFAIATAEQSEIDADRGVPEETVPVVMIGAETATALRARMEALDEEPLATVKELWKAEGLPRIERLPVDRYDQADALVALYEQGAADGLVAPVDDSGPEIAPAATQGVSEAPEPTDPYAGFLKDDLVAALNLRGLPGASGTKDDILLILRGHDDEGHFRGCAGDDGACPLAASEVVGDSEWCPEHRPF